MHARAGRLALDARMTDERAARLLAALLEGEFLLKLKFLRERNEDEKNGWKPTPASPLPDIQKACIEHGHGGLCKSMDYDTRDIVSIDMKACFPASFQGLGDVKPYFERFGHPFHRMMREAINGPLPENIGTGFAEVQKWDFANCHPVFPAWFEKTFREERLGFDTASCLPDRIWPLQIPQNP